MEQASLDREYQGTRVSDSPTLECKKPSVFYSERQSFEAFASQKEQAKPGVSDLPLLCETAVGVKQHKLVSDSQGSASNNLIHPNS